MGRQLSKYGHTVIEKGLLSANLLTKVVHPPRLEPVPLLRRKEIPFIYGLGS